MTLGEFIAELISRATVRAAAERQVRPIAIGELRCASRGCGGIPPVCTSCEPAHPMFDYCETCLTWFEWERMRVNEETAELSRIALGLKRG